MAPRPFKRDVCPNGPGEHGDLFPLPVAVGGIILATPSLLLKTLSFGEFALLRVGLTGSLAQLLENPVCTSLRRGALQPINGCPPMVFERVVRHGAPPEDLSERDALDSLL